MLEDKRVGQPLQSLSFRNLVYYSGFRTVGVCVSERNFVSPQGNLEISGDSSGCHNLGEGKVLGSHSEAEATDAVKYPTVRRTGSYPQNYATQTSVVLLLRNPDHRITPDSQ